ncbi:MAG: efflux RND transporter permease subunit [Sedimentisphaerales bacterium]|nr:efflux RND transporter permease subunit [Sedimentisphaerales bacterium]
MNTVNPINNDDKGILSWFARNHVAANLLMFLIIAGGLLTIKRLNMEVFPEISLDRITISVPYRGASPSDVEQGVCLRVEEAIAGIDGIKRISATAAEGMASVVVEVEEYSDPKEVLDDVKAAIDRIITFPEETEKPVIAEVETTHQVITIVIYGDASEKTLKQLAEQVRNDLTATDTISQVSIWGVRPYEISIEVSEEALRRYELSFDEVAKIVSASSVDVPAGVVKTSGGEILLRTEGQKYHGSQFSDIVILSRNDGTKIKLGDIAVVRDDFEDTELSCRFDGQRAVQLKVSRIGRQDALDVARTVKEYIARKEKVLPEGISFALWEDETDILKSRLSLLLRNGSIGLVLVFLCLLLFLDFRLAFWTTMGIPVSFLGAFWLMPAWDLTINMMTLFAFILVLGIVVDDAIVVGENIFSYKQRGLSEADAAVKGVKEMAMPVFLAVSTTIIAFVPLAFTAGIMGKFLRVLPIIVMSILSFSLIEALLILPAHLSFTRIYKPNVFSRFLDNLHKFTRDKLQHFIHGPFKRTVEKAINKRYITLSIGIAIFIINIGIIKGGYVKVVLFGEVEADNMVAAIVMPMGTPYAQTLEVVRKFEDAAQQVRREFDAERKGRKSVIKHISTTIGAMPTLSRGGPDSTDVTGSSGQAHLAEINVELLGGEERDDVSSKDLKDRWREIVGEVPGVSSLKFVSEIFSAGDKISVELSHENFGMLLAAADDLKDIVRQYAGVTDIADSFEQGKMELQLDLTDSGRMLGLTLSDLARQVRQGFYGHEAQRIQRGRDDIRVMVRYPQQQRRSIADVENMRIRLPNGTQIPFKSVANVRYTRGYATIDRIDRRRIVTVTADVDETVTSSEEVNAELQSTVLPKLVAEYPSLQFKFSGEQREIGESLGTLKTHFPLALLAMYALLAVQFRSYFQPLIVMSAIPFGIVGATLGHMLLGYNLSIFSMFGIVALAGVVVNDSLIIIDLINREIKEGIGLNEVIRDSATRRFRPILLTTLTTFFGLMPMIVERSLQAKFLIPMAVSLAFGVAFATLITLFLVPSLYMIVMDIIHLFNNRKIT